MPRGPSRRVRRAGPTSPRRPQVSPRSAAHRKQLAQALSSKRVAQPLQDSDDSDKLVIKGPGSRTGGYLPRNEIYASGGVGNGDKPGSHPTRAQRRKQMTLATQSQQRTEAKPSTSPTASQPSQTESTERPETIVRPTTTAPSSTARPHTARPTSSRDNSILDGIRPRRRQHSILRAPEAEDAGLGPTDDSFALPDDESTPINAAKAANATTPLTLKPSSSASRKRKLGSQEPVGSAPQVKPVARSIPTPEPTLPPQPLSALRASGQRQRPRANDEDDSIMAPPLSSSSARSSSSSSKPRKSPQQPAAVLTEQLQALMPLKRRKTARNKTNAHPEFDIPEDSDSPAHQIPEPDQDSSFLPTRRKARKSRPREKDKDQVDSRTGTTKSKQKKGKAKTAQTTSKAESNTSTRLTLSRSAGNQGTKSPSQHSTTPRTRSLSSDPNGAKVAASSSRAKRSGGSRLKLSMMDIEAKENFGEVGETSDVLVARSDDEQIGIRGTKPPPPKNARSKWDEIDAWDMDFEEVEVWERSSEKDAR